jgi:hypothetical protein
MLKVLLAGVAAVGVITLVRRGIPEVKRYIRMEQM